MNIKQFKEKFNDMVDISTAILIYPHVSMDGDALGSAIALKKYFDTINKHSKIIINEKCPNTYLFMFNEEDFIVFDENNQYNYDLHIAVDTGDLARLGKRRDIFYGNTINIDHHKTNTKYALLNYVDAFASSTGEVIYQIINDIELTREIARAIYVAIVTDTGGFRFSNTSERSFLIASKLIKYGINIGDISKKIFDTNSIEKTKLIGMAINKLSFYHNNEIAIVTFKKEEYMKINATEEMFDGIVQIPRNVKGVRVAAIIKETINNSIKVNLRSNDNLVDVSKIALVNNGGGHEKAAGYTSNEKNIDKTLKKLLTEIKKQI